MGLLCFRESGLRGLWIAFSLLAMAVAPLAGQPVDDDIVHTVKAGDTLTSIANDYGVSVEQLLTLNDLDPEAILQIGQRLLVIRAPEYADEPDDTDAAAAVTDEEPEVEAEVSGNMESGGVPPAPVADADAPMRDPAEISAQLCTSVFLDDNQNGMMDASEALLPDATIRLLDAEAVEQLRYTTDGAAEPFCQRRLERKLYTIEVSAPPGFGLTSAPRLRVDLRAGGLVAAAFGAKQGLEAAPLPPPLEESGGDDEGASAAPRSLLRELSGLFALGLAAVVFFSGMALSIVLRWR